jgi:hypothetical protein
MKNVKFENLEIKDLEDSIRRHANERFDYGDKLQSLSDGYDAYKIPVSPGGFRIMPKPVCH